MSKSTRFPKAQDQTQPAGKSNEITAVPNLLDMPDIAGCVITADAMSCQGEIAGRITEKAADYVPGLKDNQTTLRRETEAYFNTALEDKHLYPEMEHTQTS